MAETAERTGRARSAAGSRGAAGSREAAGRREAAGSRNAAGRRSAAGSVETGAERTERQNGSSGTRKTMTREQLRRKKAVQAVRAARRERANRRAVILAMIVTVLFVAVFTALIMSKAHENALLESSVAALSESVSQAEARNEQLEESKGSELSLEEIIRIAKERFGLVFKDEIVFMPED